MQTSADLLRSLATQVRETESSTEVFDLYLLARKTYYSEVDALDSEEFRGARSYDHSADAKRELRAAWKLVVDEMSAWNANHPAPVVGLVTFSDGSSYGGRK